jgi:HemY protein
VACWTAVAAAEPREARWTYYLADALLQVGDQEGALAALTKTTQLNPMYAPAWLRLGDHELKNGQVAAARAAFERRLELAPGDAYARVGLARVDRQTGNKAGAIATLQALAADHADFSPGQNLLAAMLREAGDKDGAEHHQLLGSAAKRFVEATDEWLDELRPACYDAARWIAWGGVELYAERPENARRCFERAIELAPEKSEGHEMLGIALRDLRQSAAAVEALRRASACDDATDTTWLRLGRAEQAVGDRAAALQVAADGFGRFPKSALLQNLIGTLQAESGNPTAAIASFQAALDLDPKIAEPAVNRASLYLQQNQLDLARADLHTALERQPQSPQAMLMLAGLEVESGELDAARTRLDPLQRDYPNLSRLPIVFSQWYVQSMLSAVRRADPSHAIELGREAVTRWPDNASLHGLLGSILAQQARTDDALVELETSRRLSPDDARTVMALAQLYLRLDRSADAHRIVSDAQAVAAARGQPALAERFRSMLRTLPPP